MPALCIWVVFLVAIASQACGTPRVKALQNLKKSSGKREKKRKPKHTQPRKGIKNRRSNRNWNYEPKTSCPRESSARAAVNVIRTLSGAKTWADAVCEWFACASCGRVVGGLALIKQRVETGSHIWDMLSWVA